MLEGWESPHQPENGRSVMFAHPLHSYQLHILVYYLPFRILQTILQAFLFCFLFCE